MDNSDSPYLSKMAFKICINFSIIYTISTQKLSKDDVLIIISTVLAAYTSWVAILPVACLNKNSGQQKLEKLAVYTVVIFLCNAIITGIPVFSGMYDPEIVPKYSFMQVIVGNVGLLPAVFTLFELAKAQRNQNNKTSKGRLIAQSIKKAVMQPQIFAVFIAIGLYFVIQGKDYPAYLKGWFTQAGSFVTPIGLFTLGMFYRQNYFSKSKEKPAVEVQNDPIDVNLTGGVEVPERTLERQNKTSRLKYTLQTLYLQVMRHLMCPMLAPLFCKAFGVKDAVGVEISCCLFAQPTAVLSFAICQEYGFGAELAGFDAVFGIFSGTIVVPVLQLYCRWLFNTDTPEKPAGSI